MATPGLVVALTKPKHPDLTLDTYNKWYDTIHLQDVVDGGLGDLAVRYQHVDPSKPLPYIALYRVPDVAFLGDTAKMDAIPKTSDMLPGPSRDWREVLENEIRGYIHVQSYEGPNADAGRGKGRAIVTFVANVPEETEKDLDAWYREEHLALLAKCTGYIRSTRYQLIPGAGFTGPKFLAIHEWESPNLPMEELERTVMSTEWSKKIMGVATDVDRGVWTYVSEYQTGGDSRL
ncbi:hypothetical protein P152DRAFT_517702 [Eremomyces bilateralis CBS 781.70]|uniref:EthD domain-containing protein n=1 Tax=Eremomyces bilateralis CBS 781.70 TaxID=1392243 RepID=A0A6G1FRE5_9PEZI|nr:uncharacterized protein P152DRAFT_517702 [Eremomyces bilateralis CBS 781.70]KAF1808259.1 hypothetical protein P152DRAFT_517702 [Eremomyces bilateralis CBS 781.70]